MSGKQRRRILSDPCDSDLLINNGRRAYRRVGARGF
jgi:hypothetical protein